MATTKAGKPAKKPTFKRPPNRLTIKQVAAALRATAGVQIAAAQKLRVDRSTIHRMVQKHDSLRILIDDIQEEMADLAESHLMLAIKDGKEWAVKLWLKERGQKRGYGQRKMAFRDGDAVIMPAAILVHDGRMTEEEWAATDWAAQAEAAIGAPADATLN